MKASNDYQEVVSLLSDFFGRPRTQVRALSAKRPIQIPIKTKFVSLRQKYATTLATFCLASYARRQTVPKLSKKHKSILSEGKKLLLGLMEFFDMTSSQISLRRSNLKLMQRAVDANYFQGFCLIDGHIKMFWNSNAKFDGCILIGNRIAIPQYLQSALSRLHRFHPGQEALGDAAQNTW